MRKVAYLYIILLFNTILQKISFACLTFLLLFYSHISVSQAFIDTNQHSSAGNGSATTGYFPAEALVLLANGTEKRIAEIKPGDMVAAYDPVLEDYVMSSVTDIQADEEQAYILSSVLLILEEFSASIQASGGLAGVNLYVAENTEVLTSTGIKRVEQLTDSDFLYCYDEATRRFHIFRVYEIRKNALPVKKVYKLSTEQKNCIINSTVIFHN